jgi:hypothetical protein
MACSRARRSGYRAALLVAITAVALNGCATYAGTSQPPSADTVAPPHRFTQRFTTSDGTTHELTRIRVARDTLFGIPAGGGPEVGFALPDIQRFDVIPTTPPRPYITRAGDVLWVMPFVMVFAILAAFRHA